MRRVTSVAVVVGTLNGGDLDTVLRRLGAISGYPGTRYWSVTDGQLQSLIIDAFAVDSAKFEKRRPDFSPTEFTVGSDLVFSEHDNLAKPLAGARAGSAAAPGTPGPDKSKPRATSVSTKAFDLGY